MKNKRSLAAAVAAVCLSATLGGQIFAAGAGFTDLSGVNGQDKITSLQEQGLIKGVTDTEFRPQASLTNAEAIQLIANGISSIPAAAGVKQADAPEGILINVTNDAWFSQAFKEVLGKGIDVPNDIDPTQTITREAYTNYLIQVIEKWANLPMVNLVPKDIADGDQITPEYQGAIQRSLAFGITALDSSGAFHPQETISRAEAAVMLFNALEFLNSHPFPQTTAE